VIVEAAGIANVVVNCCHAVVTAMEAPLRAAAPPGVPPVPGLTKIAVPTDLAASALAQNVSLTVFPANVRGPSIENKMFLKVPPVGDPVTTYW
jgi:hypothetical protein